MNRFFCFLLACSLLLPLAASAAETRPPLRLGGTVMETDYFAAHDIPTCNCDYGWCDYPTIAQRADAPDLYILHTQSDDFAACRDAGLLADLSESEAVRAWTDRLRPDIRQLVTTADGQITGLVEYATCFPLYWQQDAWTAAGLTQNDVPESYTELLDFLERWMQRTAETPRQTAYIADPLPSGKTGYIGWLLDLLITAWEMQQYTAGEPRNFNTPELIALLERSREIGLRLYQAEPQQAQRRNMLPLFENYSGGTRYNAGRAYGLSHSVPFRITADQPALVRAAATITMARKGSAWLPEVIAQLAYGLQGRPAKGSGNADLLADVTPRTYNPKQAHSPATVTAGYLADLERYTGYFCFAPMRTEELYESALVAFMEGRLTAAQLAAQISQPRQSPNP